MDLGKDNWREKAMAKLFHYSTRQSVIVSSLRLLCLAVMLGVGVPAQLSAASLVAAKYLQMEGLEVVTEISIGEPPPSTIIVIQNLPPHVPVNQAQPPISSVNIDKGEVKWLLKGVEAGVLKVHLWLDQPVSRANISGEVRYRESGGNMVSIPIVKP